MKLLLISGGMYHPYVVTTPIIEDFLKAAGHDVRVTEDASVLREPANMKGYDALVFNTQRDNSLRFNHGPFTWSENEQVGIKDFISSGKGLVCLHIACYLPYNWLEYHDITGGGWIDGKSFHPPYGKVTVNVSDPKHPGVHGVADFTTYDELYMGLAVRDGNDVFITGTNEDFPGGTVPLGWTRKYGDGKVFVLLLGHDGQSCQTAEFQRIVLNGVDWVTGG